jgi:hypothetical protein
MPPSTVRDKERTMKHFMIRYLRKDGTEEAWHQDIARFIAAVDADPGLTGKILYRVMKRRGGTDYYHLAAAADDEAIKALQSRDFFQRYNEQTRRAGGGEVEVIPLEIVAETAQRP